MNPHETTGTRMHHGTLRDFLAVLFRRRWIIVGIFVITTVTVALINLTKPLFYESTGKVIVKRGVRDNLMQGGVRMLTWEEELASEVETVKSAALVGRAQSVLDSMRKSGGRPAIHIDQGRVDASVIGESNVMAMSYQDQDPRVASDVTDALLLAYIAYRKTEFTLHYPKEFFETEMARVSSELEGWIRRRRDFLSAHGTVDLVTQSRESVNFSTGQRQVLAEVDRELAKYRADITQMRRLLEDPEGSYDMPFLSRIDTGNEQAAIDLKHRLIEAQVRYAQMQKIYTPESQELAQLSAQMQDLRALLASEVRKRVAVVESQLHGLEARRAQVDKTLRENEARQATYPAQEAELTEIDTQIAALQDNYKDLAESAERAKISKATSPDWTVALLSPASKPYPKNTRDYVRLALAPIFSLIVGLGLAFFIDGLDTTVRSPREAETALELPVLASLTEQRGR